jgi:hypothetical protein
MLPGCLGRMFDELRLHGIEGICEWTADLAQNVHG